MPIPQREADHIVTALRTKSPTPFLNITNISPLWNVWRGVTGVPYPLFFSNLHVKNGCVYPQSKFGNWIQSVPSVSITISKQMSKINSYKTVNGEGPFLECQEVVNYHVDRGYSVPNLTNWLRNPLYIVSEVTEEGGSKFQVFVSWSEVPIQKVNDLDILVFKIADNDTYMVEMSAFEMMFADRCARR